MKVVSANFLLKNLTLYPDSGILACCNSWGHVLTDSPHNAWVVTEILGMTLKEWLQGAGSRRNERSVPIPPFHNRVTMALEIAQAMRYLHEQKPKVIHRT
ncbi:hypothetical protein OIU79_011695 [Salix purpurea]|uniref:Protein kinase domain-containing protein n=1 Tax=Salix purpurea TaxID=77065 RepID=A0A9Q0Q1B9_SALPP|nr:hypothetical protein OIU79_011695 [Salix purpurea]